MRVFFLVLVSSLVLFASNTLDATPAHRLEAGATAPDDPKPVGSAEGLFDYRFEKGKQNYEDLITLEGGAKLTGKVLEWADQILLFDAGGHVEIHSVPSVKKIETRRDQRHKKRPKLPDLTVAYVERLPRDPNWHGHVIVKDGLSRLDVDPHQSAWHPAQGSSVTFRVHVLNAGASASPEVPCHVLIDGKERHLAKIASLAPGKEQVVEMTWPWEEGRHTLRVEIDPKGHTPEILRWNNTFTEPIRALAVDVVVDRARYEAFKSTPNLVDSFCFEDYIQYHIRNMNALFAASVYPSAPLGVLERVRCDRIIVVDDPLNPSKQQTWRPLLRQGGRPDGLVEYAALLVLGKLASAEDVPYNILRVDWRLLQQIGLQIGLVDLTKTDTTLQQCYVLDKHERFAQRRYISRWIQKFMYTAAGFPLSEPAACYLNRTIGRPRGFQGDYLYQLPENIVFQVFSNAGTPLEGVQIDVFQLKSDSGTSFRLSGIGRSDPLITTVTDAEGRAMLPNLPVQTYQTPDGYASRANPFGRINPDGSNGLLLLRIRVGDSSEEFHFLPLLTCNIAYLHGFKKEYVHRIATRFGTADAPPSPPYAAYKMPDRSTDMPPLTITWKMPNYYDGASIEEFRVYKRTSFAGDGTKPWTLVAVNRPVKEQWKRREPVSYFDEFSYDGPYSLDTFFAVTTVDKQGRESSLSEPTYISYDKQSVQFAIEGTAAYMTLRGDGPVQMLYWDGAAGTQPYGLKTDKFEGYQPHFAGIAFTPDHQLIVTDPVNHVLAIYDKDRQELTDVIPHRDAWPGRPGDRPGQFNDPADIAIADSGNMYVADRGNHRVQILDSEGHFLSLLDEDFRFRGPHALGIANGRICVTDKKGTRCRVYDITTEKPAFLYELPTLIDAGRGLASKTGRIFITCRISPEDDVSVRIFVPHGQTASFWKAITQGQMGKYHRPRGLYLYRGIDQQFAYFVNGFPFDVRRVDLNRK